MKNSFAFLKQDHIYMSQHMGDLDTVDNCRAYDNEVNKWELLLGLQNVEGVGDNHSGYYGSEYLERRRKYSGVQHHKAHVGAGMVDNKLSPPLFSISWDGTGWGDDATVWGGEAFVVREYSMNRIASLYPFMLPGGEKAVQEPRRSMLGLFYAMFEDKIPDIYLHEVFTKEELAILLIALKKKVNAPICSSMGRLFDALSAILGLCKKSDFEGQAALLLETAAHKATTSGKSYPMP